MVNPSKPILSLAAARLRALTLVALVAWCAAPGARAQSVSGLELDITGEEAGAAALLQRDASMDEAAASGASSAGSSRSGVGAVGGATDGTTVGMTGVPRPFGANLFHGGFGNDGEDGSNPNYLIQPGDRVTVRIWGAIEFDQSLTVDARGNIFLPKVGPITVGGSRNADLNALVVQSVRTVFTDNVRVYTSLDGAQPVGVFVTGYVQRPGRFSGIPSSSALYFLDRAGGIDPARGSYRRIAVLRGGDTLASFDLYDFLIEGTLPSVQFRDGDTIVVSERGGSVTVTGDVADASVYELEGGELSGDELARTAMILPGTSHVGVSGIRAGEPFSVYVPIDEFAAYELADGDMVHFKRDVHETEIVVEIEGSYLGPSRFAVPRDTRLQDLLDHVEVDPRLTDIASVSLRRESIAARQKQSLEESLRRLEARYLTASSRTDAEARIRAQEAKLVGDFVARARDVQPNGRLVVSSGGEVADILLQGGDIVTIPRKSDSVLLSGEVLVSQAMLHRPGMRARDYIDRAGGFSDQADARRIVLVHANGEIESAKNPTVRPGDELIVLPRVPVKNLQLAATIVDILYKIALSAAVAINL